jgi:two-component system sensor histidine kinase/response regulator
MDVLQDIRKEDEAGRRALVAIVYAAVAIPFLSLLLLTGGPPVALAVGCVTPLSAILFLRLARGEAWWLWIYPLGVAPLLTCLAGAEVLGRPSLLMALLMGPAALSGLHVNLKSVLLTWGFCTFGFFALVHADSPHNTPYGVAVVASVMYLAVGLVVSAKARHLREALGQARDATARTEAALHVAQDATRARERFLATMSHELRTPLAGIVGLTQLVPADTSADVRSTLEIIRGSAAALMSVVNDVLLFSHGNEGVMQLHLAPHSPQQTVRDAIRDMGVGGTVHEKGLELILDFSPNLPDSIQGDALRLRQVVINLVGNALKFTDKGAIVVRLFLTSDPQALCLEVADTGIGIPEARRADIFDAFVQVDGSHARRHGGVGLGLAISQQLIRLMGGTLSVDSVVGAGSCFRATIPVPLEGVRTPLVATGNWLAGRRVGLAAKVQASHDFLARVLRGAGGALVDVDGADVVGDVDNVRAFQDGASDVLVVDLDRDGAALRVMAKARGVPTIVLAWPTQLQGLELDADNAARVTVEKPYTASDVQCAFNRLRLREFGRAADPARAESGGAHSSEVAPESSSGQAIPRGLEVLVVEDDTVNAVVAQGLLRKLGHRTTRAENGLEALRILADRRFDLVLMDIRMPEMDGHEATRQLRALEAKENRPRVPVVVVSANTSPSDQLASLEAGADAFAAKPLSLARVASLIDEVTPK